jgi:hypothetical protein
MSTALLHSVSSRCIEDVVTSGRPRVWYELCLTVLDLEVRVSNQVAKHLFSHIWQRNGVGWDRKVVLNLVHLFVFAVGPLHQMDNVGMGSVSEEQRKHVDDFRNNS